MKLYLVKSWILIDAIELTKLRSDWFGYRFQPVCSAELICWRPKRLNNLRCYQTRDLLGDRV